MIRPVYPENQKIFPFHKPGFAGIITTLALIAIGFALVIVIARGISKPGSVSWVTEANKKQVAIGALSLLGGVIVLVILMIVLINVSEKKSKQIALEKFARWRDEPHEANENRAEAYRRLETVMRTNGDRLDLSNLNLTRLPENIGFLDLSWLRQIHHLNLSGNSFARLPDSISHFTLLETLDVRRNTREIEYIPPFIATISTLSFSGDEQIGFRAFLPLLGAYYDRPEGSNFRLMMPVGYRDSFLEQLEVYQYMRVVGVNPARSLTQNLQRLLPAAAGNINFDALIARDRGERNLLNWFLEKLEDVRDYKQAATRPTFLANLELIVRAAAENVLFLEAMYRELQEANASCEDRTAYYFNLILSKRHFYYAESKEKKIEIIVGMARIDVLNQIAKEDAASPDLNVPHEEIEVALYYQIKLKERLKLPVAVQSLAHARYVRNVTEEMLEAAAQKVIAATEDPRQVATILLNNPEWQAMMRKEDPAYFDRLDEECDEASQALQAEITEATQGSSSVLIPDAFKQRSNDIMEKQKGLNHIRELTERALGLGAPSAAAAP